MIEKLVRSITAPSSDDISHDNPDAERLREWIVANGLGGYASGTIHGIPTRRYHGLLVAALPSPLGRTMLLNRLGEKIASPGGEIELLEPSVAPRGQGAAEPASLAPTLAFRLEAGLPVWSYALEGSVVEKRIFLPHRQNTVYVHYSLAQGVGALRLTLRPFMHFRFHDAPVDSPHLGAYRFTAWEERYEVAVAGSGLPPLRMTLLGTNPAFTLGPERSDQVEYQLEAQRGYESAGDMWSPGEFHVELTPEKPVTLIASSESWETLLAMPPEEAIRIERGRRARMISTAMRRIGHEFPERPEVADPFTAELVLAADQFLITPEGRVEDTARARAAGEQVRTVIAGYHWFTDWGRDTMISLEGLTLTTGRIEEAEYILRTFAHYTRDGLIPNMFPEGGRQGLYHTADATLWFFHAIDRYTEISGDMSLAHSLIPLLSRIVACHLKGTHFGIGVDPADGLLRQGQEGYQLTWMDAKVGDWVVTPRRGKAVEINALWYNALRLLEHWTRIAGDEQEAQILAGHAEQARRSFNVRFWNAAGGYLFDVIDGEEGDDSALRPNQLFAISLKHPILDCERWPSVVEAVRERLLTPYGLRSLAPGHPDYKPRYFGNLRARDAAYHQGTVWGWLIGPFLDAWLKLHPEDAAGARRFLEAFVPHLSTAGVGSVSEIFDAESPYAPRGCVAQAWSVAEVLRCWVKTGG